jgi:hypothetical protein
MAVSANRARIVWRKKWGLNWRLQQELPDAVETSARSRLFLLPGCVKPWAGLQDHMFRG